MTSYLVSHGIIYTQDKTGQLYMTKAFNLKDELGSKVFAFVLSGKAVRSLRRSSLFVSI
jgi:hypothetical protein